jgi:hypothetical protein
MRSINQTELVAFNYATLPAFSPTRPDGEVMRLTLHIPTNPGSHRLIMQISDEEGEAIAELMRNDSFVFGASPDLLQVRDHELETSS